MKHSKVEPKIIKKLIHIHQYGQTKLWPSVWAIYSFFPGVLTTFLSKADDGFPRFPKKARFFGKTS